jgi:uncharacterized protein
MVKPKFRILVSLSIAILLLTGFFILPGGGQRQVQAQTQPTAAPGSDFRRTVSVSGSGSINAVPDLAVVSLGVQNQSPTASQALTANNQQMEKLLAALRSAGIANADIQTQVIQLYPQIDNQPTPLPNQQGSSTAVPPTYTTVNTVEVTVRDLTKLGTILDQAVSAGGNMIQNIRFDVSNPSQDLDQARKTAYTEAARKAGQLATLSGMKLGPIVSIVESSSIPVPVMAAGGLRMDQAQSAVPVSPGTQLFTVDLQVTFELQ